MIKTTKQKHLSTKKKTILFISSIMMILLAAIAQSSNIASNSTPAVQVLNQDQKLLNYYVYEQNTDNGPTRCLSFSDPSKGTPKMRQTCYFLNDPDYLMFEYTRSIMGALMLGKAPDKILVVGLGGGTLLRAFRKILPESYIHAVEISPEIISIAKQHFGLNLDDKMRIFAEDAYGWMANPSAGFPKYDLIILDAFDADYIPPQFLTKQFVQNVKSRLSAQGVLAVNTFNGSPHAQLETKLYKDAFSRLYSINYLNRILLTKQGQLPKKDELKLPPEINQDELKKLGLTEKWLKLAIELD